MKRIWARIGTTFEVTDEDYKLLVDAFAMNNAVLVTAILDGCKHYENGESYLPAGVDDNPNLLDDFEF